MPLLRFSLLFSLLVVSHLFLPRFSLAGDSGGLNPRDALDRDGARATGILDDSFSTWFAPVNVDPYLEFKERLSKTTGFDYTTFYALMNHYGTEGGSDSQNLNGQLHTINAWTPHHGRPDAGTAIFYYMTVGQYTDTTAAQLSNNLGLTSGINDSAVNIDFFRFVGWYQPLLDDNVEIYAGQFMLRDLFDMGDYGTDDTRNFVSQIMSANPPETLPVPGLGLAAKFRLTEDWYVGGGFSDANARVGDLWNFDTFSQGEYASMAYVNYRGCICGLGRANYQFNIYSVDATRQGDYSRGLSAIFEQDIGERHVAFLKYNRADRRRGDTKQTVSGGWMRKGLSIWEDDLLGMGAGWGDPTDPARRDEYVLEAFWRAQITPSMQFTPDVQLWLDPSQTPGQDVQAAFTLRVLVDF